MSATVLQHKATVDTLRATRGLGLPEYRVLLKVHELGGRARVREVVSSLGMRSSSVTQVVDKLELKGLVTRAGDREDGRATVIWVTSGGADALGAVGAALEECLADLWSPAADKAAAARNVTVIMGRILENAPSALEESQVASKYNTSEYITTVADNYREIANVLKRIANLSIGEWRVLDQADRLGGVARMYAIGVDLILPANSVTWVVDRLESRALMRRMADPESSRGVLVEVTPAGFDVLRQTRQALDASQTRFYDYLTEREVQDAFDGTCLMVEAHARAAAGKA